MAAAVADFRPSSTAETEARARRRLTLELEPTPTSLPRSPGSRAAPTATARRREGRCAAPVLVGFAAETGSLDRAADKLRRKGIDLLVANDVSEAGSGSAPTRTGSRSSRPTAAASDLPLLIKREVADRLLDRVAAALDDRDAARRLSGDPIERMRPS